MSIATLLIVLLVIALLSSSVPWSCLRPRQTPPLTGQPAAPPITYWHGYGYGPYVPGGLGLVLLILIILVVIGRI